MKILLLPLFMLILSCSGKGTVISETVKTAYGEISGVETVPGSALIWAIQDSGNKNEIYGLSRNGSMKEIISVKGIVNTDWEDIAADNEGNLYIGDFGNNDNTRKDLAIYKIKSTDVKDGKAVPIQKVSFYYPEQEAFPPSKSRRIYDAEAFIIHKGSFYIFTKNRSAAFNGDFLVYKVPAGEGRHKAQLMARLNSCGTYGKCAITGADISPDGSLIALLSGSRVWLLRGFEDDNFKQENLSMHDLGHSSQKEGICFINNDTVIIADEKDKKGGGNLYTISLGDLKAN